MELQDSVSCIVRKWLWQAGDVLIPWRHKKCACTLPTSACLPEQQEAWLAQVAP